MQNRVKRGHTCFSVNAKRAWERSIFRVHGKFLHCALFFLSVALVLSSCTRGENSKETAGIKDTVIRYNKMLLSAAKTGDVEPLKDVLIQKEREKLAHWVASWHDSNVYMDGKIENIEFKNITLSGNTATVTTSEDWIYEYKNLETGQPVLPASHIYYEMEYIVLKKDRAWIITETKVKSEKQKEEKGNK
jgi:hypothetical protein